MRLAIPGGEMFKVKIVDGEDGHFWIRDGWPAFAADCGVNFADFIVFIQKEVGVFEVRVFPQTCLESKYGGVVESVVCEEGVNVGVSGSSNPPSFSIVMERSYLKHPWRLWIPEPHYFMFICTSSHERVILSVGDDEWQVKLGQGKKPSVFSGGWDKFATANGLQLGDKCTFVLVDPTDLKYGVLIERVV